MLLGEQLHPMLCMLCLVWQLYHVQIQIAQVAVSQQQNLPRTIPISIEVQQLHIVIMYSYQEMQLLSRAAHSKLSDESAGLLEQVAYAAVITVPCSTGMMHRLKAEELKPI